MNEDFWFGIALIEFLVLIAILTLKLQSRLEIAAEENFVQVRTGVVSNLTRTHKGWRNSPVTVFEIQEPSGVIHHVGVNEHLWDLINGISIEFWLSDDTVAHHDFVTRIVDSEGIVSYKSEIQTYLCLEKYRIIPIELEEEDLDEGDTEITDEEKTEGLEKDNAEAIVEEEA